MRNAALALLLIVSGALVPTHAGVLTRGNIFADGLAGCSIGAAVGFLGSVLLADPTATVGPATISAVIPHFGVLGGCLTGLAIATAVNGAIYFSDLAKDLSDTHRPLETVGNMVYPDTPGRLY